MPYRRRWDCLRRPGTSPYETLAFTGAMTAMATAKAIRVRVLGAVATLLAQPSDAARALNGFKASTETVSGLFALKHGFPRVVRSDEIEGLHPGFVVVLLGIAATNAEGLLR